MEPITASEIAGINSFEQLIALMRDRLDWPLPHDVTYDDITYDYEPKELGLKPQETAKIREIHQLRPLTTNQPWGIFFVSFDEKQIPIVVLRRILRALVVKQRASAPNLAAWHRHDLLFISAFGPGGARELAFAHFEDGQEKNDLPVLKVLGWNAQDTVLKRDYVANVLSQRLRWPDEAKGFDAWRAAFELKPRQVIDSSKALSVALAALAANIRARANQLLAAEAEDGPMRTLLKAFRENLIEGLTEDDFADMFAQTISYGLLAARVSRPALDMMADDLPLMIPNTNPFLKELFETFLKLGGRDKRKEMDFDELGVRDVVDMLNNTDMPAVLRDFGDAKPKEDPVIHFYELFLKEYDPQKRMQRGVFYTPRPVVSFIVRGVDEVLRTEFGLSLGLADTTTWEELAAENDKITIPAHVDPKAPFVQILDPATGTGTFLVEAIDLIHTRMVENWKKQGRSQAGIDAAWNDYVPKHLLPRLTGYELMMAPYAIAHMKVGLKLGETGYRFGSTERARIFLTNALEPARDLDMELGFMSEALAHEAMASNEAKSGGTFTVVMGNPPYSLMSGNLSPAARALVAPYRLIQGKKLKERGALQAEKNLQDDYVKFFRLGELCITRSSVGVLSLITNHSFLENRTLRGLRYSLLGSFSTRRFLDLNGSVIRPIGSNDENVFDIQQGVAVSTLAASPVESEMRVSYAGLTGSRESKYDTLIAGSATIHYSVADVRPENYEFVGATDPLENEFRSFPKLDDLFGIFSSAIITARDGLTIAFTPEEIVQRARTFAGADTEQARSQFCLGADTNDWRVGLAQRDLRAQSNLADCVRPIAYRPFDIRSTIYTGQARGFMCNPRWPVMSNLLGEGNISLLCCGQQGRPGFRHAFVSAGLSEGCVVSNKTREITSAFPLWLAPTGTETIHRANWGTRAPSILTSWDQLQYSALTPQENGGRGDLRDTYGPRDVFDYTYAVLHSPSYRTRYAEFLKSDFPRIPWPDSRAFFAALAPLGAELIALHLLKLVEAPVLQAPAIRFAGHGEARVEKGYPKFENGKVMINATRWFEDVPRETWEFHIGGYQVCEKWLKDRAAKGGKNPKPGRVLSDEDILHYRRIVVALTETRRIMAEIDRVIDEHGGWPGAFAQPEAVDATTAVAE